MSRWLLPVLLLAACARRPPAPAVSTPVSSGPTQVIAEAPTRVAPSAKPLGILAAEHAELLLKAEQVDMRDDCSGFVCAIYGPTRAPLQGNTRTLYAQAEALGALHTDLPQPGDLVFFDQTYDRNRNGKRDDELTHVGVVLEVFADETVKVAHRSTSKGRSVLYLNLSQPDVHQDEGGRVLNDFLRARKRGEPRTAAVLAGQLFRAYARVDHRWSPSDGS